MKINIHNGISIIRIEILIFLYIVQLCLLCIAPYAMDFRAYGVDIKIRKSSSLQIACRFEMLASRLRLYRRLLSCTGMK